jgi:von Willebrand factor type A domain
MWVTTGRPSGLYHTQARSRNFPQVTHFKQFLLLLSLTLFETGTYTHSMLTRRVFPAAFVVAALSGAAFFGTAPLSAQAIQKQIYVSVLDQSGAPVPDLGPSDFVVREDNVAREVLRVAPADNPMQIAVLVDSSQTARNDISQIRQALPPFVEALTRPNEAGRKNEVAIIAFGERPTVMADYSTDPRALKKGIDRLWPLDSSGAYFLDAIVETVQGFKKREAQRPVIVGIVVEGPELSYRMYDQVLEPLRNSSAALYALMIGQPVSGLSEEARSRNIVVDRGPTESGGSREQLLTSMALAGKLKQLADQLTHQYLVTYARPQTLIPPERVTVGATKPGLVARGTPVKDQKPESKRP